MMQPFRFIEYRRGEPSIAIHHLVIAPNIERANILMMNWIEQGDHDSEYDRLSETVFYGAWVLYTVLGWTIDLSVEGVVF